MTTSTYGHLLVDDLREAVAKLPAAPVPGWPKLQPPLLGGNWVAKMRTDMRERIIRAGLARQDAILDENLS